MDLGSLFYIVLPHDASRAVGFLQQTLFERISHFHGFTVGHLNKV